jgi:CubicO group peptidase (beta-lactamase class C family)
MNIDAAHAYAVKHELHALLIARAGAVVCERYDNGYGPDTPHALYSGTKSFWGIAALAAERDGILALDEPLAGTLPEFARDMRRTITPRMLLSMTAGYGFGGLGSAVPDYTRALAIELKHAPGTTFTYSGIPLQVFGAFFARKLASRGQTPHAYLQAAVLDVAGIGVASWRALKDGTHPLPTGAQLSARAWLAYGSWVCAQRTAFAAAFAGSPQNPGYGLGWWLGADGAPPDLFYASGSGGQAMYVVPSIDLVAVHFGKSASYKHEAFVKRLLA